MVVKLHVDLETLQIIQAPGQRSPVKEAPSGSDGCGPCVYVG